MRSARLPRRSVLAGTACALGAGCLRVGAERTPVARDDDWRMYGRDPGRTRFVPGADLPRDGVDVAWEHGVGAHGWLPPVVANGTVYCQYSNGLFVLDAETGEGTNVATRGGFGRNAVPMAFGSTTAYRDGALVVSYGNAVAGYAADPDEWPDEVSGIGRGRARWWADGERTDTAPPANYAADLEWLASPVVAEGRLVSVHDSGVVSAVDPDDGSAEWRRSLEDVGSDIEHTPVPIGHVVDVEAGAVVVKCRLVGRPLLVGLDLETGETEWVLPDDTDRVTNEGSLLATDGSVYTIDGTGYREYRLLALDAAAGDPDWSRSLGGREHVGLAADDATVYHVGLDEREEGRDPFRIVALDHDDGGARWEVTIDDVPDWVSRAPQPTVAGDLLFLPGERGLHALDSATGERLWTFTESTGTTGGSEMDRSGLTPAVVSGDRIVLGTTDKLYGLE